MQKHQWRIHRRKLEPDPNVKEAEALFQAMKSTPASANTTSSISVRDPNVATITLQDIIDRGVERSMSDDSGIGSNCQPLDLSPTKNSNRDNPKLSDLMAPNPMWSNKRQKTCNNNYEQQQQQSTHRSLPPIVSLQRRPTTKTNSNNNKRPPDNSDNNNKGDRLAATDMVKTQMGGGMRNLDIRTV